MMTLDEMETEFDNAAELPYEETMFTSIPKERRRSTRPDIHAFILLNELVPGTMKMVAAAEHDQIYLDVDPEQLAAVATPEIVLELERCGVHYGDGSLYMFV